jgi:hypothetical protein
VIIFKNNGISAILVISSVLLLSSISLSQGSYGQIGGNDTNQTNQTGGQNDLNVVYSLEREINGHIVSIV